jgi:hypothetical protein
MAKYPLETTTVREMLSKSGECLLCDIEAKAPLIHCLPAAGGNAEGLCHRLSVGKGSGVPSEPARLQRIFTAAKSRSRKMKRPSFHGRFRSWPVGVDTQIQQNGRPENRHPCFDTGSAFRAAWINRCTRVFYRNRKTALGRRAA